MKLNKNSKIFILLVIFIIALATVSLLLAFKLKEEPPPKITEHVPDLYQGREITIEQPSFLRGRFIDVENRVMYLELTRYGQSTNIQEIYLDENTVFDCISRYFRGPQGEDVDRLNIFLDTSKLSISDENSDKDGGENLEWFIENVNKGEAVEIYFMQTINGNRETHTVNYISENNCPNAN